MSESNRGVGRYLDLLFFVGFAFLMCHELDAVAQSEWRLLPILSQLTDEAAYPCFVLLHAPLLAVIMWGAGSRSPVVRYRSQLAIDAFLIIHAIGHFVRRNHELATFHSAVSQICIFGAGVVGLVHLVLAVRAKPSSE